MAEIEITTTGELRLAGDVVGQITWLRPFIEGEIAGVYDDYGYGYDEFGDPWGSGECSDCAEKDERIEELEGELDELTKERDALKSKLGSARQHRGKRK